MQTIVPFFPKVETIRKVTATLQGVVVTTPLLYSHRYAKKYQANISFKREDLQVVRSYKIRGAFNKIHALENDQRAKGIVCASAGNHSQGVALSCKILKIKGTIFMPSTTPKQKIEQVKMFGEDFIEIEIIGDSFDDAYKAAMELCETTGKVFVHPFDDEKIIEGQATVGLEILEQADQQIDYLFAPVGGGGLISGLLSVFNTLSPKTKIIGVEPEGAPAMSSSLEAKKQITLESIDKFVDGAALKKVGDIPFEICMQYLKEIISVHEGKVCQEILDLYNKDAIVVEPAGALTIAALDQYAEEIKGKNVVCVISGGNNDITRTAEIKERALLYAQLKHYFIVKFPQRAGALKEFVAEILGPNDDITHFQYTKKNAKENASAVVGIELKSNDDLESLITKMKTRNFFGEYLNDKPDLFQFFV